MVAKTASIIIDGSHKHMTRLARTIRTFLQLGFTLFDRNIAVNYGCAQQQNQRQQKMQANCWQL
jgi:hypothetical protein